MLFTITAAGILLCLLYYLYFVRFSRLNKFTANIPSLNWWPIIGSVLELGTTSEGFLQNSIRIVNKYGPVVIAWAGNQSVIILSGVDEIQAILTNSRLLKKGFVYEFLEPWLGSSLATSYGEEWRKQRKILTPAFHFKMLEQFTDVFSSNSDILINQLKSEVGKPGFDITQHVALCALDNICETSMGVNINAQLQKDNKFVRATNDITASFTHRMMRPWLYPNIFFYLSSAGKLFYQSLNILNDYIDQVIDKKRKLKAKTKSENIEDSSGLSEKKRSAFLDLLLEYNITDEEIKNHVNTIMFTGHESTTWTTSFVIYCLMKYPKIQEKLVKELNEIFGDSDRTATFNDLKEMKYLECVIQETLRLYPIVPLVLREITEDVQISSNYILPKGCYVCIFFYKLHRDPKLFPEPEVFNPERFLPDVVKSRHPYAYCPFSGGPRNCIGQKFGMLEIKVIVSAILRNFKILPPVDRPDIILCSEIVLRSRTGIHVRLENR